MGCRVEESKVGGVLPNDFLIFFGADISFTMIVKVWEMKTSMEKELRAAS